MIIRQVSRIAEKSDVKFIKCFSYSLPRFFCIGIDNDGPAKRQNRKLREWRKIEDDGPKSFFGLWDRTQMGKKALRDTSFGNAEKGEKPDLSLAAVWKKMSEMREEYDMEDQLHNPERLRILGSDLAAAHFLLHRGGKIKFRGDNEWIKLETDTFSKIPNTYSPKFVLSEIDCSGMNLYYEGLLNLENLTRVKWASFKGNKVLNVWGLDRIVGQIPSLEYLDISDCPKIDERGLEALYKLFYLKTLIVTNFEKSDVFELTCLMLEDCNPNLKCEILLPKETSTET